MRTTTVVVAIGIGLCALAAGYGQSGVPAAMSRVAVVNMSLVFERAQMVQDLERVFGQERAKVQTEAESRREKIRVLQKELESGAFAADSTDFQERQIRMEQLELDLKQFLRKQDRRLLNSHKQWFENLYKRVTQACEDIALAEGTDIVLSVNPIDFNVPESGDLIRQIIQKKVVYMSPRVDQTAQVLERVDREYQRAGGAAIIKLDK